jgi:putative heme iron utilization protein
MYGKMRFFKFSTRKGRTGAENKKRNRMFIYFSAKAGKVNLTLRLVFDTQAGHWQAIAEYQHAKSTAGITWLTRTVNNHVHA